MASTAYTPVRQLEEHDSFDDDSSNSRPSLEAALTHTALLWGEKDGEDTESRVARTKCVSWDAFKFVLLASVVTFIGSLLAYGYRYSAAATDVACQRKMWAFSPIQEAMEWEWRQYDSDDAPIEYYGEPTEERRALWERIYDEGNIGYPYDKLHLINKSADDFSWWRLPPPNDDQVIAFPEMTHQMHCVAFLWLFAYREHWDYRTAFNISELLFELHVNHCYLTLFTMIRCQADVTPVLFRRDHTYMGAWKPRDAPHRCKKFDKLAEWERQHRICRSNCQPDDLLPDDTSTLDGLEDAVLSSLADGA
ncbi:hypothetical protein C8A03DRAFT_12743 [Achaetomium macrosporum]|uniref:Tat pathway signal sequence n=1 Tax=Achaetomium macrosporum TaxID=79813 RepID=A0AAN7CH14_9PEZI|nr:hypothetical protein C8A03DRAFT_12743 [Achaetomium macrosporum]